MRVLYDHQAFVWSKYAGIPRYFSELINKLQTYPDMDLIIPDFYTISEDYRALHCRKRHLGDGIRNTILRDRIIYASLSTFNKNPTKLICTPVAKHESIKCIKNGCYDLFHPTHFDPYFQKHIGKKPYILTIHDLSVEIYPEYVSLTTDLRKNTEISIKNASRFVADSYCTKRDFEEYYDVDSDLVDVIYLAPTFDRNTIFRILNTYYPKYNRKKAYFLFVNMRTCRKNFYTLVNAIRKILLERDMELICVGGGPFTKQEQIFLQNSGISTRVIQCTVDNEELCHLYKNAVAFLYPSVNEGFGIPILEAYACGCPVVLSNASCLPEIGGEGAAYFDPKSIRSIRDVTYEVMDNEKLRASLREKGYKQLESFSWERCAEETKKSYERVL